MTIVQKALERVLVYLKTCTLSIWVKEDVADMESLAVVVGSSKHVSSKSGSKIMWLI